MSITIKEFKTHIKQKCLDEFSTIQLANRKLTPANKTPPFYGWFFLLANATEMNRKAGSESSRQAQTEQALPLGNVARHPAALIKLKI